MRNPLLLIHIAAVGAWIGANLAQLFLMPAFERAGHAAAAVWYDASAAMGKIYYSVVGVLIAVTGMGLVDESGYSYGNGFVGVGFTVIVIGLILGVTVFGPRARAAKAAHEAQDAEAAARARRTLVIAAVVDTAIVLFAVWAMVKKLGV